MKGDAYFNEPRGGLLGILGAILTIGAVVASPFVGLVGDRWGRRL
jgi:MFS family permease